MRRRQSVLYMACLKFTDIVNGTELPAPLFRSRYAVGGGVVSGQSVGIATLQRLGDTEVVSTLARALTSQGRYGLAV